MGIIPSIATLAHAVRPPGSYWTAKLTTGRTLSEVRPVFDRQYKGFRPLDWSLDMVATGDIFRLREITLHCPNGQIATMHVEEPGTIFQLKIATMHILTAGKRVECQLIGKVIDKERGMCSCHIWDRELGLIRYTSSVYSFGSWREGILPLGALSFNVLGLRLN